MVNHAIIDFGTAVERLRSDETFRTLVQQVTDAQTCEFLSDNSTPESRETAHHTVRGLNALARHMQKAIQAKDAELRKLDNEKDQDRDDD